MVGTSTDPQIIGFVLPRIPESVALARFHVRATLDYLGLGEHADDAATITSELTTNAVEHVKDGTTLVVGLSRDLGRLTIVVTDSSPESPVIREVTDIGERGRGLHMVAALSALWGWLPTAEGGKAVYAVLMQA